MSLIRIALCLALALPAAASAFESIETDTIGPLPDGGSGGIGGAIDGRSGNTDLQSYTVDGRVNYRSRDTEMFVLAEHSRAKVDGNEVANSTWAHAHFTDEFQRGLAAEAFVDNLRDDFRLLDSRAQVGAGARFTLDYTPHVRAVYAGIGLLHEWEDQAGGNDHYWRLNSYFAYKRQLNEQVRALFNVHYQPRLDEGSDYLVTSELAALVKLAEHLDLKAGVKYEYDSNAPRGIKADDTHYVTSITYHF